MQASVAHFFRLAGRAFPGSRPDCIPISTRQSKKLLDNSYTIKKASRPRCKMLSIIKSFPLEYGRTHDVIAVMLTISCWPIDLGKKSVRNEFHTSGLVMTCCEGYLLRKIADRHMRAALLGILYLCYRVCSCCCFIF